MSVGEVVRAAHFQGVLAPVATRFGWEKACEDLAADSDMDSDEAAIDSMIEQFRYDRDLESVDETEAWLEARGLTADDLQAYFTRLHWWNTLKEKVAPVPFGAGRVDSELLDVLAAELLFSGGFAQLAVGLSWRLIAHEGSGPRSDPGLAAGELTRFLERSGIGPENLSVWLCTMDRGQDWLDRMLNLEAEYRLRSETALSPAQLSHALSAARLPLTRLKIERVEFDTFDSAREALLCVRDDGLALEDVARESRYPFERLEIFAEDLPDDQRQHLLCAKVGDMYGPVPADGVFHLSRLLGKSEPTLEDPLVRSQIEPRILDAHFSGAGSKLVTWILR